MMLKLLSWATEGKANGTAGNENNAAGGCGVEVQCGKGDIRGVEFSTCRVGVPLDALRKVCGQGQESAVQGDEDTFGSHRFPNKPLMECPYLPNMGCDRKNERRRSPKMSTW